MSYKSSSQTFGVPLDTLYINHSKQSWWDHFKQIIDLKRQVLNSRVKIIFDKRKRTNLYTRSIRQQLQRAGISRLDLLRPETFSIAKYIYPNEEIIAAIYGKTEDHMGSALLVVTDQRLIYLNQIPLFASLDEFSYDTVSGVSSLISDWDATVILHTTTGSYILHSVNTTSARNFIYVVNKYCIHTEKAMTLPA
jgi:hypothetical protein